MVRGERYDFLGVRGEKGGANDIKRESERYDYFRGEGENGGANDIRGEGFLEG